MLFNKTNRIVKNNESITSTVAPAPTTGYNVTMPTALNISLIGTLTVHYSTGEEDEYSSSSVTKSLAGKTIQDVAWIELSAGYYSYSNVSITADKAFIANYTDSSSTTYTYEGTSLGPVLLTTPKTIQLVIQENTTFTALTADDN